MLCQLRTLSLGVGVLAICFMLSSLSWQYVLWGFATASIAWACFSFSRQLRPRKREARMAPPLNFERNELRRSRRNLYSFPNQELSSQISN